MGEGVTRCAEGACCEGVGDFSVGHCDGLSVRFIWWWVVGEVS